MEPEGAHGMPNGGEAPFYICFVSRANAGTLNQRLFPHGNVRDTSMDFFFIRVISSEIIDLFRGFRTLCQVETTSNYRLYVDGQTF